MMARRAWVALALALGAMFVAPAVAHATAGDLYAAGTAYRASTYVGHRSYFGAAPIQWVADINANAGDAGRPLYAPEAGSVAIATTGWGSGYGNSIVWTSADGREQLHVAHLSAFGATGSVEGGALIGYAGSTGNSSGDHMHVSRAYDGRPAPLVLSGIQIAPSTGLGTQYLSAGQVRAGIRLTGVVDGLTYYCPVTVGYACEGVDPSSVACTLDGVAVAPGTTISAPGTYCFTACGTSSGGVPVTRTATFTIASPPAPGLEPVFRFYNAGSGTHFFTPTHAERDEVVTGLGARFAYEGVAYWLDPAANTQPLYRFYNRVNGSHFYTADPAEQAYVAANLTRTYTYEGETYRVNPVPVPGATEVHRFYNVGNGSHFFTADPVECERVRATLGHIYRYEGPVFWLGQ